MLCVPAASVLVVHAAVRLLPLPANATAEHPAIEVAQSLKLTDPVGFAPATVAVKVTLLPTVEGFAELLSVVVVDCGAMAYAIRRFDPSVAYTAPLATIKLFQWKPPERARLHTTLPDSGSSARTVLPLMENTILFATTGDVPPWTFCHRGESDGLPLTSNVNCNPEAPLLFTTKSQV